MSGSTEVLNRVLVMAQRASRRGYCGTDDVLLAMLRDGRNQGAYMLAEAVPGITAEKLEIAWFPDAFVPVQGILNV